MGRTMTFQPNYKVKKVNSNRRGNVGMFLGSDGGILGVGTPEIVSTVRTLNMLELDGSLF